MEPQGDGGRCAFVEGKGRDHHEGWAIGTDCAVYRRAMRACTCNDIRRYTTSSRSLSLLRNIYSLCLCCRLQAGGGTRVPAGAAAAAAGGGGRRRGRGRQRGRERERCWQGGGHVCRGQLQPGQQQPGARAPVCWSTGARPRTGRAPPGRAHWHSLTRASALLLPCPWHSLFLDGNLLEVTQLLAAF